MEIISAAVLVVTGINALVLLARPIPRLHSRLDILEARLVDLQKSVERLIDRDCR